MKAPAWMIACCVSFVAAAPATFAQIPPVLPTDVTGVGPGSPGNPMLQMQVDNLLNSQPQPAVGVAGISTQAVVIPNSSMLPGGYMLPYGYTMQPRYYLLQNRSTGQRYMMRAY